MKKIFLLFFIFLCFTVSVFGQYTVGIFTVPDAGTAFGKVKSNKTMIFQKDIGHLFYLTAKATAVDTLTTASKSDITSGVPLGDLSIINGDLLFEVTGTLAINDYRLHPNGVYFDIERWNGASWVTQSRIGGSFFVNNYVEIIKEATNGAVYLRDDAGLRNLVASTNFTRGTLVGDIEGETYVSGENSVFKSTVKTPFAWVDIQTDESLQFAGTSFYVNYTTADADGFKTTKIDVSPVTIPINNIVQIQVFLQSDLINPLWQNVTYEELQDGIGDTIDQSTGEVTLNIPFTGIPDTPVRVVINSVDSITLKGSTNDGTDIYFSSFDAELWTDDIVAYQSWKATTYAKGNKIWQDRDIYICNTAGAQATDFATNASKWNVVGTYSAGNYTIDGDVLVHGDVVVDGTITSTATENLRVENAHIYTNAGYTIEAAKSGGLVHNLEPQAENDTVSAGAFVSGIAATSNPTVVTVGTTIFVEKDIIQISTSSENDGIFEVYSHTGNILTVKGIGTIPRVYGFASDQFTANASDDALIRKIEVTVICSSTDGSWEIGKGSDTDEIDFEKVAKVAGVDGSIQFNDSGISGGSSKFTYDSATGILDIEPPTATGSSALTLSNDVGGVGLSIEHDDNTDDSTISADVGNLTIVTTSFGEPIILDPAGNVGVGTASPLSPVHMYEDNALTGVTAGLTIEQDGTGDSVLHHSLTGGQQVSAGVDNSSTDDYKISASSNIGTDTLFTLDSGRVLGAKIEIDNSETSPSGVRGGVLLQNRDTTDENHTAIWNIGASALNAGILFVNDDYSDNRGHARIQTRSTIGFHNQNAVFHEGNLGINKVPVSLHRLDIQTAVTDIVKLRSDKAVTFEAGNFGNTNSADFIFNKGNVGFNQSEFAMYNDNNSNESNRYFRLFFTGDGDTGAGITINKGGPTIIENAVHISSSVNDVDLTLRTLGVTGRGSLQFQDSLTATAASFDFDENDSEFRLFLGTAVDGTLRMEASPSQNKNLIDFINPSVTATSGIVLRNAAESTRLALTYDENIDKGNFSVFSDWTFSNGINDGDFLFNLSTGGDFIVSAENVGITDTGELSVKNSIATPFGGFGRLQNRLKYSQDFDNAAWVPAGTDVPVVTPNNALAPDGTMTADTVSFGGPGAGWLTQANIGVIDSSTYNVSMWLRLVSGVGTITARMGTTGGDANFAVTSEWKRFDTTLTKLGGVDNFQIFVFAANTPTVVEVWGGDVSDDTQLLPYVHTTDTAVTTAQYGLAFNGDLIGENAPVTGPNSSVANTLAVFSDTSGKVIENNEFIFSEGGNDQTTLALRSDSTIARVSLEFEKSTTATEAAFDYDENDSEFRLFLGAGIGGTFRIEANPAQNNNFIDFINPSATANSGLKIRNSSEAFKTSLTYDETNDINELRTSDGALYLFSDAAALNFFRLRSPGASGFPGISLEDSTEANKLSLLYNQSGDVSSIQNDASNGLDILSGSRVKIRSTESHTSPLLLLESTGGSGGATGLHISTDEPEGVIDAPGGFLHVSAAGQNSAAYIKASSASSTADWRKFSTVGSKVVEVWTLADLPTPVSNVITLEAKTYRFMTEFDFGINQVKIENFDFVIIEQDDFFQTSITYSGTLPWFIGQGHIRVAGKGATLKMTSDNATMFDLDGGFGAFFSSLVATGANCSLGEIRGQSEDLTAIISARFYMDLSVISGFKTGLLLSGIQFLNIESTNTFLASDAVGPQFTLIGGYDFISFNAVEIQAPNAASSFLKLDPTIETSAVISRCLLTGPAEFFESGITGAITLFADASVPAESITSVSPNLGKARFNFAAPPTLFVGQKVVMSALTNYPNGTFTITATGAGYFETGIDFNINDTGSFLSNSVTVTSTTHGLLDGQTLGISGTMEYNIGSEIYNALANTFQINAVWDTAETTGTWDNGSLTEVNKYVTTLSNGQQRNSHQAPSFNVADNVITTTTTTSWGNIVFGTAGNALLTGVINQNFTLLDEITGLFRYDGVEPLTIKLPTTVSSVKSGGTIEHQFRLFKTVGTPAFDPHTVKKSISTSAGSTSFHCSALLNPGDEFRPQIKATTTGSTVTITDFSL